MEKDWNINKGFGDVLVGLIDDVNKAAAEGDVKKWFSALRILYRNVAGHKKIDKDIIKKIDNSLREVRDGLDMSSPMTEKGRAVLHMQESIAKDKLDQINVDLITEMHKAGLILPIYKSSPEFASLEI